MTGLLGRRLAQSGARTAIPVPAPAIALLLRLVLPHLGPSFGAALPGSQQVDVADLDPRELRAQLSTWGSALGSQVVVILVSDREGAVMEWEELLARFDDLWYPGADDLLVLGSDVPTFLSLSHEEVLVRGELVVSRNPK